MPPKPRHGLRTQSLTAIHEAGHAVVGAYQKDPFTAVTIVAHTERRTDARGHCWFKAYPGCNHRLLDQSIRIDSWLRFMRKRAISGFAGRAAVDHFKHCLPFRQRDDWALEGTYTFDERYVTKLFTDTFELRFTPEDFAVERESLMSEARRIIAIPFVSSAVAAVANELAAKYKSDSKGMPSKRVRQILATSLEKREMHSL